MHTLLHFNYLAVLLSATASFIVGGILVTAFGKQLAQLNGATAETRVLGRPQPKMLIGIFLANLAMAFGVSFLINTLGIATVAGLLWLELLLVIGFVGPLTLGQVWEGKSLAWWFANVAINAASLFAMMFVLAFWP